jgi:hypothetical protein
MTPLDVNVDRNAVESPAAPARRAGPPQRRRGVLARVSREWIRPLLLPIARGVVRYAPHPAIRRVFWARVIAPFFIYADRPFVARTVFGAALAGRTKDLIQRHIFYFGVWEPNLTSFLASRLRDGDVFVDVGANIGYFSLLASRLVGRHGKVVAIEASPNIFAMLSANLARNGAANVEAINIAVSDRVGTTQLLRSWTASMWVGSASSRSTWKARSGPSCRACASCCVGRLPPSRSSSS